MNTNEKKNGGGIKLIDWKRYAMDFCSYEIITTFGNDFDIAEAFGLDAIRDTYDPKALMKKNRLLKKAVSSLADGTFKDPDGGLKELHDALLKGASWHKPDHYFICLDFEPYLDAKLRANHDYTDRKAFARKCLLNAANAGSFSSDRTIREYAREIWGLG